MNITDSTNIFSTWRGVGRINNTNICNIIYQQILINGVKPNSTHLLKDVLYNELENIEEKLELLEPKERLELMIKLMPYVFPKVVSISHGANEPLDWDM